MVSALRPPQRVLSSTGHASANFRGPRPDKSITSGFRYREVEPPSSGPLGTRLDSKAHVVRESSDVRERTESRLAAFPLILHDLRTQ